jgi:type I restriction-modification system DNA methylase subunit
LITLLDLAIRNVQTGGYIAIIMPRSFLVSEAGSKVRRNLLESCDVTEIWELPGRMFPDAKVQPIVLFARKESGKRKTVFPIRTRNIQKSTIEAFKRAIRKPDLWYHDSDHAVLIRSNLVCHDVHFDPIQRIMRPI